MEDIFWVLSKTVKHYRKAIKETQETIADRSELSVRYYQQIEQGTKRPSLITLLSLARALEVTPDKLIMPIWDEYCKTASS